MAVVKTIRSLRADYNLTKTRADCKMTQTKFQILLFLFVFITSMFFSLPPIVELEKKVKEALTLTKGGARKQLYR